MGKIAFVFAGQGAQYTGMGKELYDNFSSAKNVFDMAQRLRKGTKEQCFYALKEDLSITINTQPCLFAVCLACAEVLKENGITADGVAGFSLGEIPAVAFSGVMSYEQAFLFVIKRAEYMQECAEKNRGNMFAVLKLTAQKVIEICSEISGAYPVNFNCEGQTVVACDEKVSDTLCEKVTSAGGKAIKLSVSGAFHSPFMKDASEKIGQYLESISFNEAGIPVYSNYTAGIYGNPKILLKNQVKIFIQIKVSILEFG